MFARKYRLPASVRLEQPLIISSPFFTLRIARNNSADNRYGFIVSKKVDKRAVVRNNIKRRIRTCMETLHPKLVSGHDVLFIVKKEAIEQETEVLSMTIKKLLQERKLL